MANLIKTISNKINKYLENLIKSHNDLSFERIGKDTFTVKKGSTLVQILVKDWKEDTPLVECISYMVRNVNIDQDIATKLLLMNWEMPFGSFSIDPEDNCIVLSQCLIGSTLDEPELQVAVENIVEVANEVSDLITSTYGGNKVTEDSIRK